MAFEKVEEYFQALVISAQNGGEWSASPRPLCCQRNSYRYLLDKKTAWGEQIPASTGNRTLLSLFLYLLRNSMPSSFQTKPSLSLKIIYWSPYWTFAITCDVVRNLLAKKVESCTMTGPFPLACSSSKKKNLSTSAMKMKTVCFSETLVQESTRRHNLEHRYPHRRENLKSRKSWKVFLSTKCHIQWAQNVFVQWIT
jgi:hypothetical protein